MKIYCEALEKETALRDLYKGTFDIVICEESTCLYGHENREKITCSDGKERFVCPLEDAVIEF